MTQKTKMLLIAAASVTGGLCNGLLGAGGGIILVFAVSRLCGDEFEDKKEIFTNTQAAMIPVTAVSCLLYLAEGSLRLSEVSDFILPASLGGIFGAFMLSKIRSNILKYLFAVIVVWSGIRMLFF